MIQAPPNFHVACPSCRSEFPIDPAKVPEGGVHAICSACERVFLVEVPEGLAEPTQERPTHGQHGQEEEAQRGSTEGGGVAVPKEAAVEPELAEHGVEAEHEEVEVVFEAPPIPEAPIEVDVPEDAGAEEPETDTEAAVGEEARTEGVDLVGEAAEAVEAPDGVSDEITEADEVAEVEVAEAVTDAPTETAETAETAEEEPRFEDLSTLTSEAMADEDLDDQLAGSALSLAAERFGKRDPGERARRLARVLVSDIIAYYPARYRESFARGTVKEDFEDEVKKSWKEYVDQVGLEVAESTPHFENALNEILGKGEKIF